MYLKDKAFKYLKNQNLFWQFQGTFHMHLDIGRDGESSDEDYYDDEKRI